MVRNQWISAPGYPEAPFIENIGVHPDVEVERMTRENRMRNGAPYGERVSAVLVKLIERGRQ